MSDGVVRICNQHGHELRLIGADLVCPAGHACPVDWSVKALPWADPKIRTCPLHGVRLTGAGEILDCQYGHEVSIRLSDRPDPRPTDRLPDRSPVLPADSPTRKRESQGAPTMPKTTRGELKPHGTPQRYWRGCRCQPCKTALADHQRARIAAKRAGGAGAKEVRAPRVPRRGAPGRAEKAPHSPSRATAPTAPAAVDDAAIRAQAEEILTLRQQLRQAVSTFARMVGQAQETGA